MAQTDPVKTRPATSLNYTHDLLSVAQIMLNTLMWSTVKYHISWNKSPGVYFLEYPSYPGIQGPASTPGRHLLPTIYLAQPSMM